jgi:hypothetical protein
VSAYARHRRSWYAGIVGPFVCSDDRLTELQEVLGGRDMHDPLPVSVTVRGGAGALEPALTWVSRDERLLPAGVEIALRDEDDLGHNAARMTTMLAGTLPEEVPAFLEMPRLSGEQAGAGWLHALDEVAAAGHRAKFRTGGLEPTAFPDAAELATAITAALDREVAFKCTAGLHNAVRHTDPDTGFEHHGFLNVLLGTRACLDGADRDELADLLEERDGTTLVKELAIMGDDAVVSARRWFVSFGSCSVVEPVEDLVRLGLVSVPPQEVPA